MYRFLHVSVGAAFGFINAASIHERLNDLASDWLAYNGNCWILWTDKSPVTVSEMLRGHISVADQILVFAISNADVPTGLLPEWMWGWINRPRDPHTGAVATAVAQPPAATNLFAPSAPASPPNTGLLGPRPGKSMF